MNKHIFHICLLIFCLSSCKSIKKTSVTLEKQADLIQLAISDFSKGWCIFKRKSIYAINTRPAANNPNVSIVSIGENNTKLLLTSKVKVGSKGTIPSRYFEKNGDLFYWRDDNYPLTDETLAIFRKYNLLQDDLGGEILIPDNTLDEKRKFSIYYFCKNNPNIYKKLITNKGRFYDQAPNISCDGLKN